MYRVNAMELKGVMGSASRFVLRGALSGLFVLCAACDSGPVEGESGVADAEFSALAPVSSERSEEEAREAVESARPVEVPDEAAFLELGTNTTGLSIPDSFRHLTDGDDLTVELGFRLLHGGPRPSYTGVCDRGEGEYSRLVERGWGAESLFEVQEKDASPGCRRRGLFL